MSEDAVAPEVGDQKLEVSAEDLSVTTLLVLCGCSDGKLRAVAFENKNAKQVHGYIRHIQGGHLKLKKEPVLLVMETPENLRAIELAGAPRQLGRPPSFWERIFRFRTPLTVGLRTPLIAES